MTFERLNAEESVEKKINEEITTLGIRYQIVTEFTSFLAVDAELVNPEGERLTIDDDSDDSEVQYLMNRPAGIDQSVDLYVKSSGNGRQNGALAKKPSTKLARTPGLSNSKKV